MPPFGPPMHETPIVSGAKGLQRLTIRLDPVGWHDDLNETLWAQAVAPGKYRLQNIPAYALGYSFRDIVCVERIGLRSVVQKICLRGGHSTYWLNVEHRAEEIFARYCRRLALLGCLHETDGNCFYAIDVPPQAGISDLHRILDDGERAGVWHFQEAQCSHLG